jgi:hypothetical protein
MWKRSSRLRCSRLSHGRYTFHILPLRVARRLQAQHLALCWLKAHAGILTGPDVYCYLEDLVMYLRYYFQKPLS